jgi:hypothetical protein
MTGKVKGFKAKICELNSEIRFDHCFLRREAIVAKILSVPLQSVSDVVVKIVNFVKSRPLNSRLLEIFLHSVQTGSEAHPVSYTMGKRSRLSGDKAEGA